MRPTLSTGHSCAGATKLRTIRRTEGSNCESAATFWVKAVHCAGAYAWRQALDAGAPLAFGSDFPVEEIDPREGLRAAITRRPAGGPAWMPEQRLRRDEALHAYTAGAAWAEFAETRRGCIREGFDADLTVFSRDVMAVHVDEIRSVPVAATVVRGRVVYAGG